MKKKNPKTIYPSKKVLSFSILQKLRENSFYHTLKSNKVNNIFTGLILLMLAGLFMPKNGLENSRQNKMAYPWLVTGRLDLADKYYQFGYLAEAQSELAKIENSGFMRWQLAAIPAWQKKYEVIKNKTESKKRIETKIGKWENWLESNPPSRDIYLNLSQLYWQIKDNLKAQYYASQAAYLDPIDEKVQEVQMMIDDDK